MHCQFEVLKVQAKRGYVCMFLPEEQFPKNINQKHKIFQHNFFKTFLLVTQSFFSVIFFLFFGVFLAFARNWTTLTNCELRSHFYLVSVSSVIEMLFVGNKLMAITWYIVVIFINERVCLSRSIRGTITESCILLDRKQRNGS